MSITASPSNYHRNKNICNFSAGPAALPFEVLDCIYNQLWDWKNLGVSIMELGHRTQEVQEMVADTEANLRTLLHIPDNYSVLFMPGGARAQFTAVPLNIKGKTKKATYIDSGYWSKFAIQEAKHILMPEVLQLDRHDTDSETLIAHTDATSGYLHYTANETIDGIEFPYIPETIQAPLVADMSSNIFTKPINVNKFGIIYACAQKNLGIAGVTLVIVNQALLDGCHSHCPSILNYTIQSKHSSMYNTPPVFAIYVMYLVSQWVLKQGGIKVMQKQCQKKSALLYDFLDNSDFYSNSINKNWRSRITIPFHLTERQLEPIFLKQSAEAGLKYLKGHRSVGGVRACLYNAITESQVVQLIEFMKSFEQGIG